MRGRLSFVLSFLVSLLPFAPALAGESGALKVGLAGRDVTPDGPVWLNGYAARQHASVGVAHPLLAQAAAFEDSGGARFVLVSVDNCEGNRDFAAPVLAEIEKKYGLPADAVAIVWSHTHSAPCLDGVLAVMFSFKAEESARVEAYTRKLREAIVEVVGEALADLRPARLERGASRAGFAMNRRAVREDQVVISDNPEGPVDHEVPVLAVRGEKGEIRAILFGYACHGTTVSGGDDWYMASGDYMGFARRELEAAFPGAKALYVTGCGADQNPSPRGALSLAHRHGLELAGAVAGVLSRPMVPVEGKIRRAFARLPLPLAPSPNREKLAADLESKDPYIKARATRWMAMLDSGKPLPTTVDLPMGAVRVGDGLTFLFMGGEVVVDYSLRLKRELSAMKPWVVGYAYEVPCYIPTARIIKEGGYEPDTSLIYYGIYGPFLTKIEGMIVDKFRDLVRG